ncbi:hypothetical protein C8Q80DRAFT_6164 [Daedaleopsis nitida]|nr:hypothetical protein C8Q80DRAFT_6164 [Daedaleopsis nitida]
MATAWDIYSRQLISLGYGHPLWGPEPCSNFGPIRLGDVGYLREGHFRVLFNTMEGRDDPVNVRRGLPVGFQIFVPPADSVLHESDKITQPQLHSKSIQSIRLASAVSAGSINLGLSFISVYEGCRRVADAETSRPQDVPAVPRLHSKLYPYPSRQLVRVRK